MPERTFGGVIFDMDGVLLDTAGVYERHWRDWARRNGLDSEAPIAVHHGRPAMETIALVAPEKDARAEAAAFNALLAGDPDADGVSALDGAIELLQSLPAGCWAIATSAPRVMAERWLAQVGFPVPAALVTVEDVAHGKPAPDPYVRAAKLLGIAPGHCLVIEDAPAGVTSARSAGATVVAVLTTHAASDLAEADDRITDLLDLSLTADAGTVRARWTPT
jgi:sugar-phosphatase